MAEDVGGGGCGEKLNYAEVCCTPCGGGVWKMSLGRVPTMLGGGMLKFGLGAENCTGEIGGGTDMTGGGTDRFLN